MNFKFISILSLLAACCGRYNFSESEPNSDYVLSGLIGTVPDTIIKLSKFIAWQFKNAFINLKFITNPLRNSFNDPDFGLTTPELIVRKGYPVEVHHVVTRDGYVLELHRIPGGNRYRQKPNHGSKPVVFLQHGILSSSSAFVVNTYPDQCLGFILADLGYDVWLGNARGNTYSRKHITYSNKDERFWYFCNDETALIDIPTMIDYVLQVTGRSQLSFLGYSMGTTTIFGLLSESQYYNTKINVLIAMAPVAKLTYSYGPSALLSNIGNLFTYLGRVTGTQGELLPSTSLARKVAKYVCGQGFAREFGCALGLGGSMGLVTNHINRTRIPVLYSSGPAGTSSYSFVQFAQIIQSRRFQKYDFGNIGNIKRYGKAYPPEYDIRRIKVPVAVITSPSDTYSTPKDVDFLRLNLPNIIADYSVPAVDYSHIDFVWASDAKLYVYPKIVEILNSFNFRPIQFIN